MVNSMEVDQIRKGLDEYLHIKHFYGKYVPEFLRKTHPLTVILEEPSEMQKGFLSDLDECLSSLEDDPFLPSKVKASRNPPDFFSIVSELKVATNYKIKDRVVALLPVKRGVGGDFKMGFRNREIFFEVKRITEPEKIADKIMQEIRKISSPFNVVVEYDPLLSGGMTQTVVDETRAEIKALVSQKGRLPVKKVLPYVEIQIDKKDRSDRSKKTGVVMMQREATEIPFGPIKWKIRKLLEEARRELSQNEPSVLAIDIHRLSVDTNDIERALYGEGHVDLASLFREAPQKVQEIYSRDPETIWEHGLIPKRFYREENGLFFDDENNVINAVIAFDIGAMKEKEIFVNPFVEENRFMSDLKRFLE